MAPAFRFRRRLVEKWVGISPYRALRGYAGGVLSKRRFANGEMDKAEFKARENISGKKSVV
jgi:hypothetical protein